MFEFSSDDDVEHEIDAASSANAARIIGTRLGRQRGEFFCGINFYCKLCTLGTFGFVFQFVGMTRVRSHGSGLLTRWGDF